LAQLSDIRFSIWFVFIISASQTFLFRSLQVEKSHILIPCELLTGGIKNGAYRAQSPVVQGDGRELVVTDRFDVF
jgi:hypothetical protein